MLMEWAKLHMETDKSSVVLSDVDVLRSKKNQVVGWIRSSIASASDTLGVGRGQPQEAIGVENSFPPEVIVRERKGKDVVEPVSFPAFLNEGAHSRPAPKYNYRRASLLDGLEKTMELAVSRRAVLVPPLSETKNKLNRAFKNMLNSPGMRTDLEGGEQSLLPVPIPLPNLSYHERAKTTALWPSEKRRSSASLPRQSTAFSIVGLVIIFVGACSVIGLIYNRFPELSETERTKVKLPSDIEDAKELGRVLSKYKNTYYYEVMSAFFVTYIFLQTFAIPGSVFLSILSGFMYPFYIALPMVCMCSGIGASGCYAISLLVGKPLVRKYLEERVRKWNEVVDGQREHLFNYLLFLRITPFLPNWFINIVSPVIEIPISTFFIATFLGVAPLSFIAIEAGTTLYQLTTASEAISWTGICVMAALAGLSLVPVLVKNRLKEKFS